MSQTSPTLSRRAILASLLSTALAGSVTTLAIWGGVSRVAQDSFAFSRGTSLVASEADRLMGMLGQALSDERIFVTIIGHSGTEGDSAANRELSEARAQYILGIATELGIPSSRMTALGVGGAQPLPKEEGESDRAHQSRLARVEIFLQVRK